MATNQTKGRRISPRKIIFRAMFVLSLVFIMVSVSFSWFNNGKTATVTGKGKLTGATVYAHDLRAGAALVIAGLAAEGVTRVENIHFVERGYESIVEKLSALGARIKRIEE